MTFSFDFRAVLSAVLLLAPASALAETKTVEATERSVLAEQILITESCAAKQETDPKKCAIVKLVEDCIKGQHMIENRESNKDKTQGFRLCKAAADKGSVVAQAAIGNYYLVGINPVLKVDLKQAREYLERSAAGGHPQALFNLGVMYDKGKGVRPDTDRAMLLYLKSAQIGYAKAQLTLAEMLVNRALDKTERTLDVGKATEGMYWACLAASRPHENVDQGKKMCDMLRGALPKENIDQIIQRIKDSGVDDPYLKSGS